MILTNGVVRTMDPSLPTSAALAIAGERIVGGVGTHESALPTPDRVDLRGRCVVPAFTDAHVHFPTWSLARTDVVLEGVGSRAQALARVGAHRPNGEWIRGHGWRDAEWEELPSREALDPVTGERPAALWSKDYHSLWLNSAALARAGGDLEVPGGVVERDASGAPTGVLREESAWRFREKHVVVSEDEWVAATRDGHSRRPRARHRVDPRQGRLARRPRDLRPDPRERGPRRCACGSRCRPSTPAGSASSACARGSGTTSCVSAT